MAAASHAISETQTCPLCYVSHIDKFIFCSTEWHTFFVSGIIPVGHVRWHVPSFHALLPRICIHSAAKSSGKYK
jgi:hypothetical protein